MTAEKKAAPRRPEKPRDGLEEVTVVGPFQVSHDGRVFMPGDKATVPIGVAESWRLAGYVK